MHVDVLIVGSGPVGAVFSNVLEKSGRSVLVVESGPRQSARYGEHLKNSVIYQKNSDIFGHVIRGSLSKLSVSPSDPEPNLDPAAMSGAYPELAGQVAMNGANPEQNPYRNLPEASATHAVGGMATHWTCATPRHHPTVERSGLFGAAEWDELYGTAEAMLRTSRSTFDDSLAHKLVLEKLREEYSELPYPYDPQSLPIAARRHPRNQELVEWSGTDTLLEELAEPGASARFDILSQHLCTRLVASADGERIRYAEVRDLTSGEYFRVFAETFVVASGGVGSPQLLWASGIRPDPLGRYLTEHPTAFCQVALLRDIVHTIGQCSPDGRLPFPSNDLEPNVCIPVSESRPWHCQIHRDAFHYGDYLPTVDRRVIVDLRWFGIVDPRPENRVTFSERYRDKFGMPQPTFDFSFSEADRARQHEMMADMLRAASGLGGFLPGSEPRFVPLGVPQHIAGTMRMGESPSSSVVDRDSRVWGMSNLYVGGNGVIPTGTASNPTLTSVALALRSARAIARS